MRGTVARFDLHKGYGILSADDAQEYFFHCTQIANGSRTIAEGATVEFEVRRWHRGQLEATRITEI